MRDFLTWSTATAFLLTALYAVTVRREMVTVGRSIGQLSQEVSEQKRRNDNLELEVSRLRSPGPLRERALVLGVTETGEALNEGPLAR
jgi:cell division protein FtsL